MFFRPLVRPKLLELKLKLEFHLLISKFWKFKTLILLNYLLILQFIISSFIILTPFQLLFLYLQFFSQPASRFPFSLIILNLLAQFSIFLNFLLFPYFKLDICLFYMYIFILNWKNYINIFSIYTFLLFISLQNSFELYSVVICIKF